MRSRQKPKMNLVLAKQVCAMHKNFYQLYRDHLLFMLDSVFTVFPQSHLVLRVWIPGCRYLLILLYFSPSTALYLCAKRNQFQSFLGNIHSVDLVPSFPMWKLGIFVAWPVSTAQSPWTLLYCHFQFIKHCIPWHIWCPWRIPSKADGIQFFFLVCNSRVDALA